MNTHTLDSCTGHDNPPVEQTTIRFPGHFEAPSTALPSHVGLPVFTDASSCHAHLPRHPHPLHLLPLPVLPKAPDNAPTASLQVSIGKNTPPAEFDGPKARPSRRQEWRWPAPPASKCKQHQAEAQGQYIPRHRG